MRVRTQSERQRHQEEALLHPLSRIPQHTPSSTRLQAKLTVSTPGDSYEQEADQVADQVMRMAEPRFGHDFSRMRVLSDMPVAQTSGALVQRQDARTPGQPPAQTPAQTPAQATTLPTAEELTTRIARCIGIWETNRGKDDPAPKESSLDTVAGVHASMATIEQATTPYAITALKKHKELRDKANPPLTLKELNDAEARCAAVTTLIDSVSTASAAGTTPDDFIKNNTSAITATGLSNEDVKTMFKAVTLRATLDKALTDMNAAEKAAKDEAAAANKSAKEQKAAGKTARDKALKDSIDAIPAADRLGLGEGSLKSYINKPKNWGENRAGWMRKAVAAMPGNIGARIEAVTVSDHGTGLAGPVIRSRVDVELAKNPVPSEEDIVKTVAQQNNPNETDYGKHVWENYDRLYPKPKAATQTPP